MREIECRGKRIDNGELVYGDLINSHCDMKTYIYQERCVDNSNIFLVEVIPETVGQFTELLDKNKAKIYEGDILGNSTTYNLEVTYCEGHPCIKFIDGGEVYYDILLQEEIDEEHYYLIGNIHDNPELLEEE